LWTPEEIDTAIWLDAADEDTITLNSGNVSQWDDKSGNDRHATQGTAGAQPEFDDDGFNESPTIKLNGTSHFLTLPTDLLKNSSAYLVFVVCDVLSTSGRQDYLHIYTNGVNTKYSLVANRSSSGTLDSGWRTTGSDTQKIEQYTSSLTTGPVIISSLINLNSGEYELRLNGDEKNSGATFNTNSENLNSEDARIGATPTVSSGYANFNISEVVILEDYNLLTEAEKIEGYLAWKWGLEDNLPSGHPYKDNPPTLEESSGS
jgi:hypothetical protein